MKQRRKKLHLYKSTLIQWPSLRFVTVFIFLVFNLVSILLLTISKGQAIKKAECRRVDAFELQC